MIPIFIGYDPREAIAYHVCTNSIIRHSSHPVSINPLALNILKDYEEKHTDGSNHFIYSRFLVPHLMQYKGCANAVVTPEFIQNATGAQVHRFTWLADELVGELPAEWNWLDIEYEWNPQAKLVHYTLGTPCFHEFSDQGDFANEWHREKIYVDYCLQHGL